MATLTKTSPTSSAIDRGAILRNHPLFRELPAPMIERLVSYMSRRTVARGKAIFEKGESGTALMAVVAGAVRISVPSVDGRDVVLNIIREGEIFGEIALLDGGPRTADATAATDCELLVIERRDFLPFLRSAPDVAVKLIEILCARLRRTSEQVEDLTFLGRSGRLAKVLLRLGSDVQGESPRNLKMTQRELSQIIGMSRESTNKQLRIWEKRKLIRLERGAVTVLQPEALADIALQAEHED